MAIIQHDRYSELLKLIFYYLWMPVHERTYLLFLTMLMYQSPLNELQITSNTKFESDIIVIVVVAAVAVTHNRKF